jgi:hypothetical protein
VSAITMKDAVSVASLAKETAPHRGIGTERLSTLGTDSESVRVGAPQPSLQTRSSWRTGQPALTACRCACSFTGKSRCQLSRKTSQKRAISFGRALPCAASSRRDRCRLVVSSRVSRRRRTWLLKSCCAIRLVGFCHPPPPWTGQGPFCAVKGVV